MIDYAAKLAKIEKKKQDLAKMSAQLKQRVSKQKQKEENLAKNIFGAVFLKNADKEELKKYMSLMTASDKDKVLRYLTMNRPEDYAASPSLSGKKG